VQADPIKPMLKAPGTERLKPNYDKLLSNVAFKFNLGRYTMGAVMSGDEGGVKAMIVQGTAVHVEPINPPVKAPRTKCLNLKYNTLLSTFGFNFNLRRYTKVVM
jgi:hypothetical protein